MNQLFFCGLLIFVNGVSQVDVLSHPGQKSASNKSTGPPCRFLKRFSSHWRGFFSDLQCLFSEYYCCCGHLDRDRVWTLPVFVLLGVNQCDTVEGKQLKMWNKCCCEVDERCTLHHLQAEILSWLIKVKDTFTYSYIYIYLFVYVQIVMQRYKDRSLHTRKMHTVQTEAYFIPNIAYLYSPLKFFWSNLT